jgi:micrococcal nuclease
VAARTAEKLERPTLGLAAGRFAAFVVTVGAALAACSGGEVATLADDSVETTTPDTGTAAEATPPPATAQPEPKSRLRLARVARVIDGDTLETVDGRRIRLVQIDASESSGECYGAQATAALEALLPAGSRIGLERDPELDDVDRYGRQLRYVFKGRRNLNVVLVRRGAASVWFFDGDRGRYADRLLATARTAKARKRGAWGACRAQLDPSGAFETSTKVPARRQTATGAACMSGYSPCLAITGDLDCTDVRALGRALVLVSGDDPYRLDSDGNGYGCE